MSDDAMRIAEFDDVLIESAEWRERAVRAEAERDELRAALQKIIDGTMDEYVERVARTALARREGTDDEAR